MASPVQGEGEIGEGDGEGSREMYVYAPTTKNYYVSGVYVWPVSTSNVFLLLRRNEHPSVSLWLIR
eukprot:1392885-Amorphochlora_amoeboformis.AAC.1